MVIDRSGSMAGSKIKYAQQAAIYAVEQLSSDDRISVTIYDNVVEVIIPSQIASGKQNIINRLKKITPRGMTALYSGWLEGATQVSRYLQPEGLNRFLNSFGSRI